MKTTVFYDGERGTARLDIIKEVHHDIDIHELTSRIVGHDNLIDAVMYAIDLETCEEEVEELLDNDDIRQGLLLMVAHEIINHPTKY